MPLRDDIGAEFRKLLVPAAASLAGAGAGLALTRKPVREAMPDLGDLRIGDLADDLRGKLDSILGKGQSSFRFVHTTDSSQIRRTDSAELEKRRREREQRRSQRRARH